MHRSISLIVPSVVFFLGISGHSNQKTKWCITIQVSIVASNICFLCLTSFLSGLLLLVREKSVVSHCITWLTAVSVQQVNINGATAFAVSG